MAVERQFGVLPRLLCDGVPITGKIDRIDDLGDQTALVIDYKTGRHQSKSELLGKSQAKLSEREQKIEAEPLRNQYRRQLLFYKLLCQLSPDFHHKITSGALHFVKVGDDHKIRIHQFNLEDNDVKDLRALIKQVWQEIQTLQFLTPDI